MVSDLVLVEWSALCDVNDQFRYQFTQIEPSVEAVGECSQIMGGVFAVLQCVISPGQRGFQISKNRIDPVKLRQVSRLARTNDHWIVDAASGGHGGKATQSIADDRAVGRQGCFRPLANGVGGEATHHAELQKSGSTSVIQRNGRYERHLVLRSTTRLAACALATKVGVVDLDGALEPMAGVARGHGAVDLVVQQPSGRVAHTELAFERQRRQTSLRLTDQINGQEPGGQWQLGVLHQTASSQRCLMPTAIALEQTPSAVTDNTVRVAVAARATKAARPTSALDRRGAMRLGAKVAMKFRQRHSGLKLDSVEGHWVRSMVGCTQITRSLAHKVS